MEGLSLAGRLEKISEALVLADLADYAGLAKLHTQFEEFVRTACDSGLDPRGIQAARVAAQAIESIVLEESKAPAQAFAQVARIAGQLQRIVGGEGSSAALDQALASAGELTVEEGAAEVQGATEPVRTAASIDATLAAEGVQLPANVDVRIFTEFLARQAGVMEQLEHLVLKLEQGESAGELPRLLHTLKGEAALLGLIDVESMCHAAEDYLGRVEPKQGADHLLEVKDWLTRRFESYAGKATAPGGLDALLARLDQGGFESVPAAMPLVDYSTVDRTLAPDFVSEASEHLEASDGHLLTLEATPESADAINAVFRAFHTLKGGAGMISAKEIGEVAHEAEGLLDKARKGGLRLTGPVMDVTFETVDTLKRMVAGLKTYISTGQVPRREAHHASLIKRLRQAASGQTIDAAPTTARRDGPGTDRAVELPTSRVANSSPVQVKETVKVDADRLDRLVDMIGELVIAESMVSQSPEIASLNSVNLARQLGQLDKITRGLQEMATSLRMVPLRSTFQKMARLVRDLSRKTGKEVEFVTNGEDTELDKTVVDGISDPLVHMVRNAVDHGIESDPSERASLGKSAIGRVELRAFHKGGNIFIQLEDDGRGMDRDAILAKGRERGLVREGEILSEREIWNLIFAPGLSTAKKLTEVSGRGVGMDVVKKSIDNLRGQVEIRSEVGKGTLFTIKLPLTLAIIDGMVVRVGHERYIVPTLAVVRSLRPKPEQVSSVFNRGEMLNLSEGLVPLMRLGSLFQVPGAAADPLKGLVVVVEDDGKPVCLLVDELLGQQQIVIKNLGEALGRMPGLSGSAIMADGRVGLIVDVGGLVRMAQSAEAQRAEAQSAAA